MQTDAIKVIIADDHPVFRDGLRVLLESIENIVVVGEARDGEELVSLAFEREPDLMLVDIVMPHMNGVTATKLICEQIKDSRIIGLSAFGQDSMFMEMLDAGALGYLLKNAEKQEIQKAINTVMEHKPYFCNSATEQMSDIVAKYNRIQKSPAGPFLTNREKDVISMICKGYTSKQIGKRLFISQRTVEGHRTRIMDKLGVKSVAGIITYGIANNLNN